MRAAKVAGYDLIRVEVDPKSSKITLVVREDENIKTVEANPWDTVPLTPAPTRKRRVK